MYKRLRVQKQLMNRQTGASSLGIMAAILVVAALVTVGVKVGPLYMDNISLNSAIKSAASKDFHALSAGEIRQALQKTFQVNGIKVNTKKIDIKKTDRETTLTYKHEERANVISNIDVVVTFENYYSTADQ